MDGDVVSHETPEEHGLSIGALSESAECAVETIRYYERIELLPAPPRTGSGRRVYGRAHVERLRFIRRARDLGFPLEKIRMLIDLARRPVESSDSVLAMTQEQLGVVRAKLVELRRIEAALDAMVRHCPRSTIAECSILGGLSAGSGRG